MTTRTILELDPAAARELASWTSPVPDVGASQALFALGIAFDLRKALAASRNWQRTLVDDGSCGSWVPSDTSGANRALLALSFVGSPQSLGLEVDAAPGDAGDAWSLRALMRARSPQAAVQTASMLLPLSPLLESEGQPVELDLAGVGLGGPLWAVLTEDALAVATGADAATRVEDLVAGPSAPEGTLFGLALSGRLASSLEQTRTLGLLLPSGPLGPSPDQVSEMQKDLAGNLEALRPYDGILERMVLTLQATDAGLELRQTLALR